MLLKKLKGKLKKYRWGRALTLPNDFGNGVIKIGNGVTKIKIF